MRLRDSWQLLYDNHVYSNTAVDNEAERRCPNAWTRLAYFTAPPVLYTAVGWLIGGAFGWRGERFRNRTTQHGIKAMTSS